MILKGNARTSWFGAPSFAGEPCIDPDVQRPVQMKTWVSGRPQRNWMTVSVSVDAPLLSTVRTYICTCCK